jgi:hypothetical protein
MFSSLGYFAPAASASSHPRNGAEAWSAGYRGIVEPQNPFVLQQLHNLCPTIDEEHFTVNFLSVYTYSMRIPYAYDSDVYGVTDYWQTSEETISLGRGDCEDQAINLATLIEALYKETYGYIPSNLVWVVIGHVVVLGGEGDHGWVLVNEGALPRETIEEIKSVSISEAIINIILGGIAGIQDLATQIRHEIEVSLDLSTLPSKNNQQLSLLYSGERYFELEPTMPNELGLGMPVSEYYFKKYPYTKVYAIFNSQGYDLDPDFYPVEQPPYMGAEIKNIAFPLRVVVGNTLTVNVTVQNYDCGTLGADLVVVLKDFGVEVTRKSAYVFKYWWQIQTFVFNLQAVEPAQTEELSVELFWHNYWPPFIDDWILEDFKNFTMVTISNKPDLVPYSGFTYPKSASEGQLLLFSVLGQNLGPMSAGSYAIDIFIDGAPFDRVTVAGCAGFSGFQTQTRPWVATAGTHSVMVVVDSTGVISEHNETNNEMVVSIEVRANKGSYSCSQVSANSDDSQKWNNTNGGGWQWNLTYSMNVAGCPYVFGSPLTGGEDNFGCGLRFTNITVPQEAKVTYARLEFCASCDDESPVKTKIHGENIGNAPTFSTLVDFDARNWTSAFVFWDDIPAWKTSEWYFSPDISEIIQEIVDRSDWKSGNSMTMIWEDFESRSISYIENSRRAWSHDANPTLAPRLLIDYEDITPPLIAVISPENTSYLGSVPLTITINEPVSWIGYSLDGKANVTLFDEFSSFRFRKSHVIDSSAGTGTNYPVKIVVWRTTGVDCGENVYVGGKCRADFGDIKFTGSDGASNLDYWLETYDSAKAVFWVEIAESLDFAARTIYMYYGDEEATTTSNGTATFLLFDHFDNGTTLDETIWNYAGNPMVSDSFVSVSGTASEKIFSRNAFGAHSAIRGYGKLNVEGTVGGVAYIGYGTHVSYPLDAVELWNYKNTSYNCTYAQTIRDIGQYNQTSTGIARDSENHLWNIMWNNDSDAKFQIDSNDALQITNSIPGGSQPITLQISDQDAAIAEFDWILVRKFVDTEPVQRDWGTEEQRSAALTDLSDGSHCIVVYARDMARNVGSSGTIYFTVDTTIQDIAVVNVTLFKNVVGQGYSLGINATIENQGDNSEVFNVTFYGNTTIIATFTNLTLPAHSSTIVGYSWNTSGFSKGNYTISANATVVDGELDSADNNLTGSTVLVSFVGDVNGDGRVRVNDILLVAMRFGTDYGGPPNSQGWSYDANCDINGDLKIRVYDVLTVAQHFGEGP